MEPKENSLHHQPDNSSSDIDKQIQDLISDFSLQPNDDIQETEDIDPFDASQYSPVEVTDEENKKIKQLRQITAELEKKAIINYSEYADKSTLNTKIDYKSELNDRQFFAVTQIDKPVLVIAGAGSGKTRTIVFRVGYLLEQDIDPASILLLTFTRKAAKEMIDRTTKLLGNNDAERVTGGTFHSFSNYILRKYANLVKLPPSFSVIDNVDSEDIISLLRDEVVKQRTKFFPKKGRIYEIISKSRNIECSIEQIIESQFSGLEDFVDEINFIAKAYEQYKKANHILDYDDLLIVLRDKLKESKRLKELLQKKFQYILVDEYQDTNKIQKDIVDLLAEKNKQVMIVGDDSQSIYSFRGANFENILLFPKTYPNGIIVKLEQNYRSNQSILDFTNDLIFMAKIGYRKNLFTTNNTINIPVFKKYSDQEHEAAKIVDKIIELREKGIDIGQQAVIYRASFHGNYVQAELMKRNIPYVVVGGIKFVERRHVRDTIAYLRIILNPYDAAAWHRVLKILPGIGNVTAKKIILNVRSNKGDYSMDMFKDKKYYNEISQLGEMLEKAKGDASSVHEKVEIVKQYYHPILKNIEDDHDVRILDVDLLLSLSSNYNKLDKFLSDFALDPPSNRFQDSTTPLIDEREEDPLTLTTVHSAKGLEWHTVFLPHLLDGLFPLSRTFHSMKELEEERRLFYVACTRAKENLYLSMPMYFQSWEFVLTKPSRFLADINKQHFKYVS